MEKVVSIIANALDLQTEDIKPTSEFRKICFDSLDQVEIIIALENEFEIDIAEEDIDKLITIQDLADFCAKYSKPELER